MSIKPVILINALASIFLTALLMWSLYYKKESIQKEVVLNILDSFMVFLGVVSPILFVFFIFLFSVSGNFWEKRTGVRLYGIRITLRKEFATHVLGLLKFSLFLLLFILIAILFIIEPVMMFWVIGFSSFFAIYIVLQLLSILERFYLAFCDYKESMSIFVRRRNKK